MKNGKKVTETGEDEWQKGFRKWFVSDGKRRGKKDAREIR